MLSLRRASARTPRRKAPEALIKEVSTDVLDAVKADKSIQAGDIRKVIALVDQKVLPYVNFQRMTASAVGRYWKQATPEQQKRLQDEFKLLLVRTYSGALSQVSAEQTVELKPMRAAPTDNEVVVRTEIKRQGRSDPARLPPREGRRQLEDLRRQRARRLAGRELPQQLRAGNRRQRHRRPDRQAGRAQQVGRAAGAKS